MSPRKILIADPDAGAARALAARLAARGHTVAALVATADDAVSHVRNGAPGAAPGLVLIGEMSGAGMTGLQAADALRRLHSVPAVLLTTDAGEAMLRSAGATGTHGSIVMPATDRELELTIELALARHDASREADRLEDRFFAVSIDMLCCLDFSGYFRRLNPAWERTLGFSREELMSRPFIEFVHPDDRERTLRQNGEVRAGGQALAFENRYRCRDGSYRWFRWNAAPDPAARVIYSVARDVTGEKQLADERERLVSELQAALGEVKALREILPICSYCAKVRDDEDYWQTVETYISSHTNTRFTHGICPGCIAAVFEAP